MTVKILGQEKKKQRRKRRINWAKRIIMGGSVVSAGIGGYYLAEKIISEKEVVLPPSIQMIKFINETGGLFNEDGSLYNFPVNNQTTSSLIQGHPDIIDWKLYLDSKGEGVDYGNSSIIADDHRNLNVTIKEKNTENQKSEIISSSEMLAKLPTILNIDELNLFTHEYTQNVDRVSDKINDPVMIERVVNLLENQTGEDLGNYTEIKLSNEFDKYTGTFERKIELIGEDDKTIEDDDAYMSAYGLITDNNSEDDDHKSFIHNWEQSRVAFYEGLETPTPIRMAGLNITEFQNALSYLEERDLVEWSGIYNTTDLDELINKTGIEDLRYLEECDIIYILDTPNGLKYSGIAYGEKDDQIFWRKIPLYQTDIDIIRG